MRHLRNIKDPNSSSKVDPHELRILGDRASTLFLSKGIPLNDAVTAALKNCEKPLNNHHVQRVVEFANLKSFRELRRKKSLGDRPVEFQGGPASTLTVLKRLGRSVPAGLGAEAMMVVEANSAGSDLVRDAKIALAAKSTAPMTKAASAVQYDPNELMWKLGQAENQMRYQRAVAQQKVRQAEADMCRYASAELGGGRTLGDIDHVVCFATRGRPDLTKLAMGVIVSRSGVSSGLVGDRGTVSKRTLSRAPTPNPEHPLYLSIRKYAELVDEADVAERAVELISSNRKQLQELV